MTSPTMMTSLQGLDAKRQVEVEQEGCLIWISWTRTQGTKRNSRIIIAATTSLKFQVRGKEFILVDMENRKHMMMDRKSETHSAFHAPSPLSFRMFGHLHDRKNSEINSVGTPSPNFIHNPVSATNYLNFDNQAYLNMQVQNLHSGLLNGWIHPLISPHLL